MGARLIRCEPGGGAGSAEAFRDRPSVEAPNRDAVSVAAGPEVLRPKSSTWFSLSESAADRTSFREPGLLDGGPCPSSDVALFARVRTRSARGAGAGVISSCFVSLVGVGSLFAGNRCGYGPEILIDLFAADPEFFAPIWTTRGGVWPLEASLAKAGELFRMIFMPGALLGVSIPALLEAVDRLKRNALLPCSGFGGDEGTGALSSSACVTLENLIAGGGSSSESLSSMSMR